MILKFEKNKKYIGYIKTKTKQTDCRLTHNLHYYIIISFKFETFKCTGHTVSLMYLIKKI